MRSVPFFVVLAVFSFLGGVVGSYAQQQAKAQDDHGVLRCRELVVSETVKVGPSKGRHVQIAVTESITGIWLHGRHGRLISIYDTGDKDNYQTAVGIYYNQNKPNKGMEAALAVHDGEGFVQLGDGRSVRNLGFRDAK